MNSDAELDVLRAQVEALQQEQELLLYAVTHDLRSPVMTILGFTDLLLADSHNPDRHAQSPQYLDRIRSAAYRQSGMIGTLQQIVTLNRQPLQFRDTDLSALFNEQRKAANPETNIVIRSGPTHTVSCDPEMMQIAIGHLLANALQLSNSVAAPEIEFGTSMMGASPVFHLRNNGTGFDLGTDSGLLSMFRRLQAGSEFSGAGINLLCATAIIHRHGGKLWIDSRPQHGTSIFFSL